MKFLHTSTSSTTTTLNVALAAAVFLTGRTDAFSSMAVPPPSPGSLSPPPTRQDDAAATTTASTTSSESWRIVLDIGREPLVNGMPFDWARSGGRMPLKIPSQFCATTYTTDNDDNKNSDKTITTTTSRCVRTIEPLSDTVSMTGPDGAVIRPIQGGSWEISANTENDIGKPKTLTFDLTFPERIARRDVSIEASSTLTCVGAVYTKSDLDKLNQEFYQARDQAWELGGELNDMAKRQGAPKKWNFETNQWEKRFNAENPLSWVQKRVNYMAAKANQDAKNRQRPDPNSLSAMGGRLPGLDDEFVFVQKTSGIVKAPNGAVMGTWQAEPINDKPASYRS